MKKALSILIALLMVFACLSLTACGNNDENSAIIGTEENINEENLEELVVCYNCGIEHDYPVITADDYELCEDCYMFYTKSCAGCGDSLWIPKEKYIVEDGEEYIEYYCDDCFNNN